MVNIVPSLGLYVCPFITGDLLQLSQKPLSKEQRGYILRSALTSLAALHNRGIYHTGENLYSSNINFAAQDLPKYKRRVDILADNKPNNIPINYKERPSGKAIVIKDVKLSDLEDTLRL